MIIATHLPSAFNGKIRSDNLRLYPHKTILLWFNTDSFKKLRRVARMFNSAVCFIDGCRTNGSSEDGLVLKKCFSDDEIVGRLSMFPLDENIPDWINGLLIIERIISKVNIYLLIVYSLIIIII